MSRLGRVAAAAGRCVVWLLPIGRGEWAEALWTEADAVPPGRPRLAWRAGGLRLLTGEILTWHRVGRVLLFAAAVALMARATWPGAAAGTVAAFARADVITTVLLLTVLPVVARRLFGPVQPSRLARFLRVSAYAVILTLMPAKAAAERFAYAVPHNVHDRRLFLAVHPDLGPRPKYGTLEVVLLLVVAAYLTALFWMTSRRSPVTPATMAIGTGGGVLFGAVMYAVTPLGLNKYATNPWLRGSAVDPLVALAWVLLFGVPVAVAILAGRRHPGPADSGPGMKTKMGQGVVAGVLASLSGALIVTVAGIGHDRADAERGMAADPVRPRPAPQRGRPLQPRTGRQLERPGIPAHVPGLPGHRAVHGRDGRRGRRGKPVRGRTGRPAGGWRARPSARSAGRRLAGGGR